jgi:hypothetical protein
MVNPCDRGQQNRINPQNRHFEQRAVWNFGPIATLVSLGKMEKMC